jgi:hypothetical protein
MYNKENLTKIKKMNELAPEVMKAFWAFDKLAVAEGAIPASTRCPSAPSNHAFPQLRGILWSDGLRASTLVLRGYAEWGFSTSLLREQVGAV